MSSFIGSKISLISKANIRYTGILYDLNSQESKIILKNVQSFGTEGRNGNPLNEIPASSNIYEYVTFRGSDVKDLHIEEDEEPQNAPTKFHDPAVVSMTRHLPPRSLDQSSLVGHKSAESRPSEKPDSRQESVLRPYTGLPPKITPIMPISSPDKLEISRLSISDKNMQPLQPVQPMQANSPKSRQKPKKSVRNLEDEQELKFRLPTKHKQLQRKPQEPITSKEDFDFEKNLEKFKEIVEKQQESLTPPAEDQGYNSKKSFFDNLSSTIIENTGSYQEFRKHQKEIDMATFGVSALNQRNTYRVRGRGRGRGGFSGGRKRTEAKANTQVNS